MLASVVPFLYDIYPTNIKRNLIAKASNCVHRTATLCGSTFGFAINFKTRSRVLHKSSSSIYSLISLDHSFSTASTRNRGLSSILSLFVVIRQFPHTSNEKQW